MSEKMRAWLRFFRVVNLPTVPGDLLVGAAAMLGGGSVPASKLIAACVAGVFLYLFGLADNDIVGAKTDVGRPISEGLISMEMARLARGMCLFLAMIAGSLANLASAWWISAFALAVAIVIYNRTKWTLVMGACRGLNVLCGGFAVCAAVNSFPMMLAIMGAIWTVYIAGVTWYSEGEEVDPSKKKVVGLLIGALIYLQLMALLYFQIKPLLIAGAILLLVLRLMRKLLPQVSAS